MKKYIDIILIIIVILLSMLICRKPKGNISTAIDREYIVQLIDSVVDARIGCLIDNEVENPWNGALRYDTLCY